MKNEDNIEKLFERMQNELDIHEPSAGHQMRFVEKLQQQNKVVTLHTKKRNWIKPLSIAASIAVVIGIAAITLVSAPIQEADLASVSPQMQDTQSFFSSAIQVQLEEIDKISSIETKELVADAMKQLEKLELDYQALKKDLVLSGNDKRVISAMIKNFQNRANLLEEVLQKMNDINEFKLSKNENPIL